MDGLQAFVDFVRYVICNFTNIGGAYQHDKLISTDACQKHAVYPRLMIKGFHDKAQPIGHGS